MTKKETNLFFLFFHTCVGEKKTTCYNVSFLFVYFQTHEEKKSRLSKSIRLQNYCRLFIIVKMTCFGVLLDTERTIRRRRRRKRTVVNVRIYGYQTLGRCMNTYMPLLTRRIDVPYRLFFLSNAKLSVRKAKINY